MAAGWVLVPVVILAKETVVPEGKLELQVGAAPVPAEVKTWPEVPGRLLGIKAPENFRFPVMSNFSEGAVLPMPTLPASTIRP